MTSGKGSAQWSPKGSPKRSPKGSAQGSPKGATKGSAKDLQKGSSLSQAPDSNELRSLESSLGRQVRLLRKGRGLTTTELSKQAHISASMLSRIENGASAPSLSSLQSLSNALNVPLSHLFHRFERAWEVSHVKSGEGLAVERRGTKAGHRYQLLGHPLGSDVIVEPFLITMTNDSQPFPIFQHSGTEFLYILTGQLVYRHADKDFLLKRGDSLFFDASAPHGPLELRGLPLRFLSIISYRNDQL